MLHINMVLAKMRRELELLKRHLRILRLLEERGPLGIIKLSHITKIPANQVRYSLRVLQESSFLQPTTKGATINQRARKFIENLRIEKKKLSDGISKI